MDVATLDIDRLIVHSVPSRNASSEGSSEVEVAGALSPLGPGELSFVRNRCVKSLREHSYGAMFDPERPDDSMVDHITALAKIKVKDHDVVKRSQDMAHALFDAQPGSASDGLLIVASATVDGWPACLVLKLEREEGVRTEEADVDGETAIRLIIEENLIWTENTKVFKTGLFVQHDDGTFEIAITDVQTGHHGVAHYWRTFLGCTYLKTPDQATLEFYEAALNWINDKVSDPERRGDYVRALHTELSSNRSTFSPTEFATNHLKGPDRSGLLDGLVEAGVSTTRTRKDTSRIEAALRRLRIKLDGIEVSADGDAADRVTVETIDHALAKVTVTGTVRRISGSGR